jgi:methionyl-tRNA formyltransferase
LAVPRLGTINVHPSLLPKYRGASPIQWALANGDAETGVSVLYVTPKMDAGDLLAQERYPIAPEDTFCTLEPKLAAKGAELLVRVLDEFRAGKTQGIPQDEAQVTFARKLSKEDGRVDWRLPAEAIRNRLRGFAPWPGAYTVLPGGALLKIHEMKVEDGVAGAAPGTVLEARGEGPLIAAGKGAVRLVAVQPAGKKAMGGRRSCAGTGWRRG